MGGLFSHIAFGLVENALRGVPGCVFLCRVANPGQVGECIAFRHRLPGWPHGVKIRNLERHGGRSLQDRGHGCM